MTLGFKQKFPWGEPTNFREKILYGVGRAIWITPRQIKKYPKIHTMRADPTNRWKAGRKIEMVYRGAGYKILDHFNKGIPELEKCVSVQKIKILVTPYGGALMYDISIDDGPMLTRAQASVLAVNDGFDSLHDFERWFKKDFTGKIIHFTDLRY